MKHLILYAEDDAQLAAMYRLYFERAGYEVNYAKNGKEALRKYEERAPDIIILDIKMPVMDGDEVVVNIRKRDSETPILMLTADTSDENEIKCLKLDADGYVRKSQKMEVVLAVIRRYIERHPVSKDSKQLITPDTYIDNVDSMVYSAGSSYKIGFRENNLLQLLCRNKNIPLNREFVESQVWGDKPDTSERQLYKCLSFLRKITANDERIKLTTIPCESIMLEVGDF